MPEYLHPGVYIEETSYRGKPIQGVSTSTAGFVGAARKGPTGRAEFIGSFSQFRRIFGDQITTPSGMGDYLGHSVKSFFDNGGARCYAVRCLADDAQEASVAAHQGISLRLASGAPVRGQTREIKLNALRGVENGSQLRIYTRPDASGDFTESKSVTVESYDAKRNMVTVIAADEIPTGTEFDPNHTAILIDGIDPPALPPAAGAGPTFTARYPGVDGNALSVQIRPRDLAPVGIRTVEAVRADPALDLTGPALAVGDTTLQMTAPALRILRVGDLITVGPDEDLAVTAIADGNIEFDVTATAADHSAGGGVVRLVERGGTVLSTPFELGTATPAFAINMTAGGASFGPSVLVHNWVMLLQTGDILEVTTGPDTSRVRVTAVRTAQDIGAGAHVTVDAPLTAASALRRLDDFGEDAHVVA